MEQLIAIIVGLLAIIFVSFRKGEETKEDSINNKQREEELKNVRINKKIDNYVDSLDDAITAQQLQDNFGRKE